LMETVGGVMSGYWEMGNVVIAMIPTSTITRETTMEVTGLFINTSAIIVLFYRIYTSYFLAVSLVAAAAGDADAGGAMLIAVPSRRF